MPEAVIDASVLVAILLNEPGAEVGTALSSGALISAVNLAEVVTRMVDKGAAPAIIDAALDGLSITVAAFDKDDALGAGVLRERTRRLGLSLGDRACLALAQRNNATAYTADHRWAALEIGIPIQLIR
jgi:ribonuclease VapC